MNEIFSKREIKKVRIGEAVRRRRMRQIIWAVVILAVGAGLVAAGVSYSRWRNKNLPGEAIPDLGRDHVGPGHGHAYNSNPPTSGWHFPEAAEWGVYQAELPDENFIHNLEHGGVWISYQPTVSEDIRKKLESFYDKYGRKIIVTPRSANDVDIALAAWGRLDKFSAAEYSEARVDKFIKAFRNKGPEFTP